MKTRAEKRNLLRKKELKFWQMIKEQFDSHECPFHRMAYRRAQKANERIIGYHCLLDDCSFVNMFSLMPTSAWRDPRPPECVAAIKHQSAIEKALDDYVWYIRQKLVEDSDDSSKDEEDLEDEDWDDAWWDDLMEEDDPVI